MEKGRKDYPSGRISVVLPIGHDAGAIDRALSCLEQSIRASRHPAAIEEILLIHDPRTGSGSTEHRPLQFSTLPLRVLCEPSPGIGASINRGVRESIPENDVLVLAPAMTLYGGAFDSLSDTAAALRERGARWGSISPVTNAGDPASLTFPRVDFGAFVNRATPEHAEALSRVLFSGRTDLLEIPAGIGSCVLLSREALSEVGGFDALLLTELGACTDWCLRAARAGFTHFLTPSLFVHQGGEPGLADRRTVIVDEDQELIRARYPWHKESVDACGRTREARLYREIFEPFWQFLSMLRFEKIAVQLLDDDLSNTGGAVQRSVGGTVGLLAGMGVSSVCLAPLQVGDSALLSVWVDGARFGALGVDAAVFLFDVLACVGAIQLESLSLHSVHRWDLEALQSAVEFFANRAARRTVVVQDFSLLCRQHQLLFNDESFCGPPESPSVGACASCRHGADLVDHRLATVALLQWFERVVYPSESVREAFRRVYPTAGMQERVTPMFEVRQTPVTRRRAQSSSVSADGHPPLRMIVFPDELCPTETVRIEALLVEHTGKFDWLILSEREKNLARFRGRHAPPTVERIRQGVVDLQRFHPSGRPGWVLLPAPWPEPCPYRVKDAFAMGCPVLTTSESGAIAEIVDRTRGGKVFSSFAALCDYLRAPLDQLYADAEACAPPVRLEQGMNVVREWYFGRKPAAETAEERPGL